MRLLRTLMLLTMAVTATLALTATNATAQETPVEVIDEETVLHCTLCTLHAEGNIQFVAHEVGGVEHTIMVCHTDLEGVISEDATGEITDIVLTGPAGTCNILECRTPDITGADDPWPFVSGETGPGLAHFVFELCLYASLNPPTKTVCPVEAPIVDEGDHDYVISIDQLCPTGVEIQGSLEIENHIDEPGPHAHDAIEIIH